LTSRYWRVDKLREEVSEIKIDSKLLHSKMERPWSIGKPFNGKEVSVSQLLCKTSCTSDV
jgi:hypothetical protein